MFPQTQQLFQRLSRQFPDAREWFDALRQWYRDAKLSADVIAQLLRGENLELLSLSLNGEDKLADVTREMDGRRILLNIPSDRLRVGENTFTLGLTADAEQPLELEVVHLGQPNTRFRQKIELDTVRPTPAPAFQLTGCDRAEPRAGCWELRANGHLAFRFSLHTLSRVVVALDLPEGTRFPQSKTRTAKQKKVLKEVGKRVEEKLKKWIDAATKKDDLQSRTLADDLRAYGELYSKQIRPAIEGDGSLQTSIDRTGNPDNIVTANAQPVTLQPAVVTLVADPPVVTLVADPVVAAFKATRVKLPPPPRKARVVETSPRRSDPQPRPRPRPRPRSAPVKSGGFLGKLLVTLFLAGLSVAIYAVWKNAGQGLAAGWVGSGSSVSAAPAGNPAPQSKFRGEVLAAMRLASTDLGWQPEVCQDLSSKQAEVFVAKSDGRGGVANTSFVYIAGDRRNAALSDQTGLPACNTMLVVLEFADEAAAKAHFATLPQQFRADLREEGVQGRTARAAVADTDEVFCQITPVRGKEMPEVIARQGRFVLQMAADRVLTIAEQEQKLGTLALRLKEQFPR